jgi:hypothetical protein
VTASSLVKIDVAGNVLDPGSVGGNVNLAGFNIHGAIHRADPAAACVVHTHEVDPAWGQPRLLSLYSHRNAWANVHLLGQPNTFLAQVNCAAVASMQCGFLPGFSSPGRESHPNTTLYRIFH